MYGFTLETKTHPDGVFLTGGVFRPQSARRFDTRLDVDELANPWVLQLANAETDADMEAFFTKAGFFEPGQTECPKRDADRHQKVMRTRLNHAASGNPREVGMALARLPAGTMSDTGLVPAIDGRRLTLRLNSLYALLLMECAMVAERGCLLTRCKSCRIAFLTGSLTGRRSRAQYCSDRCRMRAARARKEQN